MASIKCKRCGISFEFKDIPHNAKQSYVCDIENCTRSYSEKDSQQLTPMFQTGMNVSNTILAAICRRDSGFKVDNGGCQEGSINV